MPFPKHEPDPNIPPPKKRVKSVINRLLSVVVDLAENPNLGEAQRLAAVKIAAEVWDRRPRPKRKTDRDKALLNALSGAKGKQKGPGKKPEP